MGLSVDVTSDTFPAEVLDRSHETPVLVDFFAQWCGPCQLLKPILEALSNEYNFVLAKVDIDRSPDLASAYGVQGVPDVKVCVRGEMTDGFVGVLQESQIRQLLGSLNLTSQLETGLQAIFQAKVAGDLAQAQTLMADLRQRYPQHRGLVLEAASLAIAADELDTATSALSDVKPGDSDYDKAKALLELVEFKRIGQASPCDDSLDRDFQRACRLSVDGDYASSLDLFLAIVERDRRYRDDGARKAMLTVFELLGQQHPLTGAYRRRLTSVLL